MEISVLKLFTTMEASGGNQLKSLISRLRLLLLYYSATDGAQGLGACWESEQHRGLAVKESHQ